MFYEKKILFLSLLMVVVCLPKSVFAAPANSAFQDDTLYKCVIDAINREQSKSYEYSAVATDQELALVKSLSCDNYSHISNLSGLNKLTNMETLSLIDHEATSIDLSSNTKLKNLKLNGGRLTDSLTSIDLSHNTLLEELDLKDNKISTIDLSNNSNLTSFTISGSELTSIDFGNINKLTKLDIPEALALQSIDISKLANLTQLDIFSLSLRNLDISHNLELTDLYIIGSNSFSSFDISNNIKLKSIHLTLNSLSTFDMTNNINLESAVIYSDNITTLNIKNNKKLKTLELHLKKLQDLDFSGNLELNELSIYSNEYSKPMNFSTNTNLESVSLNVSDKNQIFDFGSCTKLKSLVLRLFPSATKPVITIPKNSVFTLYSLDQDGNFVERSVLVESSSQSGIVSDNHSSSHTATNYGTTDLKLSNGATLRVIVGENYDVEVGVPDTASHVSIFVFLISLLLIGVGSYLIYKVISDTNRVNYQ